MLREQNVPTKMAISEILVGFFFFKGRFWNRVRGYGLYSIEPITPI